MSDEAQTIGPFDEPDSFRKLALQVQDRQFWVPRDYLADNSPVFKEKLADSGQDSILLPGKKAADVEECLKCWIPHPGVKGIDLTNADLILGFAQEYQIDQLRHRAEKSLKKSVKNLAQSDTKLLQILGIGSKYRMKKLLKRVIKRCGSEFELGHLKLEFPNLRGEVIAGLLLYRKSVPEDQECVYKSGTDCIYCGEEFSSEDESCPGAIETYEETVSDLLHRLSKKKSQISQSSFSFIMADDIQPTSGPGPFDEPAPFRKLALLVEDRKFWVSREYLASHSPVFGTMLYGQFAEANQDTISLPEKKAVEVEEFLSCLIPHPDIKAINFSNAELILNFAQEYQIDFLRRQNELSLRLLVTKWNRGDKELFQVLLLGMKYRLKELLAYVVKRCGTEFELGKLISKFPDLRGEVIACLLLYEPPDTKCRYKYGGEYGCEYDDETCSGDDCDKRCPNYIMTCVNCDHSICFDCLCSRECQHHSEVDNEHADTVSELLDRL